MQSSSNIPAQGQEYTIPAKKETTSQNIQEQHIVRFDSWNSKILDRITQMKNSPFFIIPTFFVLFAYVYYSIDVCNRRIEIGKRYLKHMFSYPILAVVPFITLFVIISILRIPENIQKYHSVRSACIKALIALIIGIFSLLGMPLSSFWFVFAVALFFD